VNGTIFFCIENGLVGAFGTLGSAELSEYDSSPLMNWIENNDVEEDEDDTSSDETSEE
jgi:hypothetical protein